MSIDHVDAVAEVRDRVENTNSVDIDTLTRDTITEYVNHWDLPRCFDVIDDSDRVSVREIGDRHSQGELSPVGGDTTVEKEIRHWAAVATVEMALDTVDADTITETVGV